MSIVKEDLLAIKPDCLAPAATEAKAEGVAEAKCKLEPFRCFVLAILAGMFIGCGALFMTYVKSDASLGFAAASVGGAACFSLGLILVVVAGAELFTGNNLMVTGALSGKVTWGAVLKNWVIVWVGNFVGSLILVGIVAGAGGQAAGRLQTDIAGTQNHGHLIFHGDLGAQIPIASLALLTQVTGKPAVQRQHHRQNMLGNGDAVDAGGVGHPDVPGEILIFGVAIRPRPGHLNPLQIRQVLQKIHRRFPDDDLGLLQSMAQFLPGGILRQAHHPQISCGIAQRRQIRFCIRYQY